MSMSTLSVLAVSDVCKNIHLCVTLALRLLSCMHRDKEVVNTFIDKKIVSLTGEGCRSSMPLYCVL